MLRGQVKSFNSSVGLGVITPQNSGSDVSFRDAVVEGLGTIFVGRQVEYELDPMRPEPVARRVVLISN